MWLLLYLWSYHEYVFFIYFSVIYKIKSSGSFSTTAFLCNTVVQRHVFPLQNGPA